MLTIRCKQCGKELTSYTIETKCCGCPNMSTVSGSTITGNDLSLIEIVSQDKFQSSETPGVLSQDDKQFQENRRQRKIRRMNFETR